MSYTNSLKVDIKVRAPQTGDQYTPGADAGSIDFSAFLNSTAITKRHHKVYNVAASGSQSLDLASALTDIGGNALTFSTVKFILVHNRSTSASKGSTVGWSSNGVPFISAAATSPVNPIYVWMNVNGTTVTASTGDIILVANTDASAAADIEVLILGS